MADDAIDMLFSCMINYLSLLEHPNALLECSVGLTTRHELLYLQPNYYQSVSCL
jgi:hypothetical protein